MYEPGNVLGVSTVIGGAGGAVAANTILPAVLPATGSSIVHTFAITLIAALATWALVYKLQGSKDNISQ